MDESVLNIWRSTLLADQPSLIHAVTRRDFNMALSVGPDAAGSAERRRRLCEALDLPFENLTVSAQVHGADVAVVTGSRVGAGRDRTETRIAGVDGLVTDEPNVPLLVLAADCCLVLAYDPKHRAIGVAHAGWRGTASGIGGRIIQHMVALYESRSEDLLVALSPCAGVCCYEVGEDVALTFDAAGFDTRSLLEIRDRKMYLNLAQANADALVRLGVRREHIDVANVCTICDENYFSHRREPGAGHFAMIAAVR